MTAPALVERILLHEAESFPNSPLEKRVFEATLGDGILTSPAAGRLLADMVAGRAPEWLDGDGLDGAARILPAIDPKRFA